MLACKQSQFHRNKMSKIDSDIRLKYCKLNFLGYKVQFEP